MRSACFVRVRYDFRIIAYGTCLLASDEVCLLEKTHLEVCLLALDMTVGNEMCLFEKTHLEVCLLAKDTSVDIYK